MSDPANDPIRLLAVLGGVGSVAAGPFIAGTVGIAPGFMLFAATAIAACAVYFIQSNNTFGTWCRSHPARSAMLFIWVGSSAMAGVVVGENNRRESAAYQQTAERQQALAEAARVQQEAEDRARVTAEERARAHVAEAEAHMTPRERVARARLALASANSSRDKVCAVRRELAAIPEASRRIPEVLALLRGVRPFERDALREERAMAREGRMVLCCDGSQSPTCECSRRSHSGCCSRHGGMCGCDPLPDDVLCPSP